MPRPIPQDILLADPIALPDAILRVLADADTHVFAEIIQFVKPKLGDGHELLKLLEIFSHGNCDE